jgi:hypothetical protein
MPSSHCWVRACSCPCTTRAAVLGCRSLPSLSPKCFGCCGCCSSCAVCGSENEGSVLADGGSLGVSTRWCNFSLRRSTSTSARADWKELKSCCELGGICVASSSSKSSSRKLSLKMGCSATAGVDLAAGVIDAATADALDAGEEPCPPWAPSRLTRTVVGAGARLRWGGADRCMAAQILGAAPSGRGAATAAQPTVHRVQQQQHRVATPLMRRIAKF